MTLRILPLYSNYTTCYTILYIVEQRFSRRLSSNTSISISIVYIHCIHSLHLYTRGKTSGIGQKYAVRNPVIFLASWDGKYFILFYFLNFPQKKKKRGAIEKKMLRYVRKKENRNAPIFLLACLFGNGPFSPR